MKREYKIDGKGFKKLKNTQYILAYAALFLCIVLPVVLSFVATEITSQWISDLLMMVGVLTAFSSAGIASYIRYKKGSSYAGGPLRYCFRVDLWRI